MRIFINQIICMKRLALVCCSLLLFSCENTWDSEARDLFHQGCMEEAAAKSMCDCRLEKAMKKYPSFSDAMANVDKLMEDEEIKACK